MFKIGDRVIYNKCNEEGIVLNVGFDKDRYLVELQHRLSVPGNKVKTWISVKNLKLDIQWYREERLKNLLK